MVTMNRNKVVIVGTGRVGATAAFGIVTHGLCNELVLIDCSAAKALGEARDLDDGSEFQDRHVKVRAGDYDDCKDADIVVITVGRKPPANSSRMAELSFTVGLVGEVVDNVMASGFDGVIVMVSNPVDVLTYVFHKVSGVPENHIIGSGTILDTSRLQAALARRFHISPKNVHAHVYGEHGDSSFVPWSLVHIANNHIDSYRDHSPDKDSIEWNGPADYADMEEFVKKSGAQVIKNKGATFYAVAVSVCHLCKCLQSTAGTALTVSTLMHGEYGVDDVCLSTLALVDRTGVRGKILNHLTEDEIAKLRHSADCLRAVIGDVEI